MKPRLLDLFCGAGGAAVGYHRAGFEVYGIDYLPQKHYPFPLMEIDALQAIECLLHGQVLRFKKDGHIFILGIDDFIAIHASPPCQFGSNTTKPEHRLKYKNLIPQTRMLLEKTGKLFVIENVFGTRKHLKNPVMLCGTMFGLQIIRHRYFETSWGILFSPHTCCHLLKCVRQGYYPAEGINYVTMTGNFKNLPYAKKASGINWMNKKELAQAIPPAYTEYIGKYLMKAIAQNDYFENGGYK